MYATRSRPTLATPILPTDDLVVCRQFAIPEALIPLVYGWLQLLTFGDNWELGSDDAAEIEDVTALMAEIIDKSVTVGCNMIAEVRLYAGTDLPEGWLYCDGTVYADTDYPELGAVIADGLRIDAENFRVPDYMTGRFPLGGLFTGTQGGEDVHTLTVSEMPSHFHIDNSTDLTGLFVAPGEVPAVIGSIAGATETAGGGESHNNMPPYEQIAVIIRAVS